MALTLLTRNDRLASAVDQLRVLDGSTAGPPFEAKLQAAGLTPLHATDITVFQVNVGKLCNQTCRHCHVDAGPDRREIMTRETAQWCIQALSRTSIPTVDLTGGAPELNPSFVTAGLFRRLEIDRRIPRWRVRVRHREAGAFRLLLAQLVGRM